MEKFKYEGKRWKLHPEVTLLINRVEQFDTLSNYLKNRKDPTKRKYLNLTPEEDKFIQEFSEEEKSFAMEARFKNKEEPIYILPQDEIHIFLISLMEMNIPYKERADIFKHVTIEYIKSQTDNKDKLAIYAGLLSYSPEYADAAKELENSGNITKALKVLDANLSEEEALDKIVHNAFQMEDEQLASKLAPKEIILPFGKEDEKDIPPPEEEK